MRTTLTLDDDLDAELRERARLLKIPFKQAVNDAIRKGLSPGPAAASANPYRIRPFDGRINPEIDPYRLNQFLDEEDVERFAEGRKA